MYRDGGGQQSLKDLSSVNNMGLAGLTKECLGIMLTRAPET